MIPSSKPALLARQAVRRGVVYKRHRGLDAGDVMIASFPRSGNTWLRFVLADLATGEPQDFESVERVVPSVGWHQEAQRLARGGGRLIKTHETHRPEYRRAVYLVRDFRDVLVSRYRIRRENPDDLSDLDDFVDRFGTPFASPFGSWREHVESWLGAAESCDGIEIHRFDQLRADPIVGVSRIADRLGLEASPERVQQALDRNTSADMRKRELANIDYLERSFGRMSLGTRDGAGGSWREILSREHFARLGPELELNRRLGYTD